MANNINHQAIKQLLTEGKRIDGRDPLQNRDFKVLFGSGDKGSVEIDYGGSRIYTTTQATISQPNPGRPSEGYLTFRVDLDALKEPAQWSNAIHFGINASDPQKYQMEIEKILERMIKTSRALDQESLCIQAGKSVWSVAVKCVVINNEGNLIDAVHMGAMLSLLHFRRPQVQIIPQQGIRVYDKSEKRFMPLSIHHIPLTFTYGLQNEALCIDPYIEEEMVCTGRITIGLNIYGDICYIHKIGGLPIIPRLLQQQLFIDYGRIIQVSLQKIQAFTIQLRDLIDNSNRNNFFHHKTQFTLKDVLTFNLSDLASKDTSKHQRNQQEVCQSMVQRMQTE